MTGGRQEVFYQASWGPHALLPGTPNEGGLGTAQCCALKEAQVVALVGATYYGDPFTARVARICKEAGVSFELGRWVWRAPGVWVAL